jgi:hypothetical protein
LVASTSMACKGTTMTAAADGLIKAHRPPTLMEDMAAALASFANEPTHGSGPAGGTSCGKKTGCLLGTVDSEAEGAATASRGVQGSSRGTNQSGHDVSDSDSDSSLEDWRDFRQRARQAPGRLRPNCP